MRLRRRLEQFARTTYRRLPPRVREKLTGVRARYLGRTEAFLTGKTLLSVVMPVYNVESYLVEAVDSVLTQSYRNLELILVDDGSTDTSGAMCDQFAQQDSRVRVIHKVNAGLGAARNTGISAARGEYIVFIDSDDYVLPDAYMAMIKTLHRTGSDLVTGNVRRLRGKRMYQAWNQSRSHLVDRHAVTLDELPELLFDTVAWNKVFRRKFWNANIGTFPVDKLYEDMVPMFNAFVAASSIDVLARDVYVWRVRDEGGSITQQVLEPRNIDDRLEMLESIRSMIHERGLQGSLGEQLSDKILEGDLWIYVREMAGASEEVIKRITAAVTKFWTTASERSRGVIPAERRISYWLLEHDRDQDVVPFRRWYQSISTAPPLRWLGNQLLLDPSDCPVDLGGIPSANLDMSRFTEGVATATRVAWTSPTVLTVDGYAYTTFVSDGSQAISVIASNSETGQTLELAVERVATSDAAIRAKDAASSHEHDGFSCAVEVTALRELSPLGGGRSDWEFGVRISDGDVVRTVELKRIWRDGSAAVVGSSVLPDGILATAKTDPGLPLRIRLDSAGVLATAFAVEGTTVTVQFPENVKQPEGVWFVTEDTGRSVSAQRQPNGSFTAALPTISDNPSVTWQGFASVAGRDERVLPPKGAQSDSTPNRDGMRAVVARTGRAVVRAYTNTAIIDGLVCNSGGGLEISGSLFALETLELGIAPKDGEPARWQLADVEAGRFGARISLARPDLAGVSRPLATGSYRIHGRKPGAEGTVEVAHVFVAESVAADLPATHLRDTMKVKVSRAKGGAVAVDISAPVADELLGRFAQARLHAEQTSSTRDLEPAVFFYVDIGSRAVDSALAIHEELRRRDTPLRLYWGVSDFSVPVPEGGVPVVKSSPAWYEKLNHSRYIVNNYGGIEGLSKHPDQRYLQTWHGTPYKFVGTSEARHNNSSDARFDDIAREADGWDAFVSPNRYMTSLIPREFCYEGPILETGYPRNDRLATATTAEQVELRGRLGIPADARVLLYAPTFRENQRQGWSAEMFEGLDLTRLLSLLGHDWYVLLRGHSFIARNSRATRTEDRLVDVTHHGDVNDLYIASDLLVTDYSSTMFDYSVTGKPIAFFTPDLDEYVEARGTYFDLAEIAPGPLYEDVDSLANGLQDLSRLAADYKDHYVAFKKRFAPWDDGKAAARVVDAFFA